MALSRNLLRCEDRDLTLVVASWAPNGAGAIDQTTIRGRGVDSVTRTGVGVYQITFTERYTELVGHVPGVGLNALADTDIQFGVYTAPTATAKGTLDVKVKTAGVAAEIAANANNRVHVILIFRRGGKN